MKKKRKALLLTLVTLMMLALAPSTVSAAVKSVQITAPTKKSSYTAYRTSKKDTLQMKVNVKVTKKSSKAVTYKSSKPSVISVNKKGKLTIKKNGTATITVTSKANKKKTDKIKIKVVTGVSKVKVTKVTGATKSGSNYTMYAGKTATVKATATPKSAKNETLAYKSSNTNIATISSKGKITAKKAGTVTITVQPKKYSRVRKATFKLTVKSPAVTGVTIDATGLSLRENESRSISTWVKNVTPPYSSYSITCASANTSVASASGTTVTGVSRGTTTVTITVKDNSNGKTWDRPITVGVNPAGYTQVAMTGSLNQTYSNVTASWKANNFVAQLNAMIAKTSLIKANTQYATISGVKADGQNVTYIVKTDVDRKIQILSNGQDVTAKASQAGSVAFNSLNVALSQSSGQNLITALAGMDNSSTNLELTLNAVMNGQNTTVKLSGISFSKTGYSTVTVTTNGKAEAFRYCISGSNILVKGNVTNNTFIQKLVNTGSFTATYFN